MEARRVTLKENVERVLRTLDISGVQITEEPEAYVKAWDTRGELLRHVIRDGWDVDIQRTGLWLHGAKAVFREPRGVRPAMQVGFVAMGIESREGYFVVIDIDEASPFTPKGLLIHGKEFVRNMLFRKKTDQQKIAAMLDKRFGDRT